MERAEAKKAVAERIKNKTNDLQDKTTKDPDDRADRAVAVDDQTNEAQER